MTVEAGRPYRVNALLKYSSDKEEISNCTVETPAFSRLKVMGWDGEGYNGVSVFSVVRKDIVSSGYSG
jgi:hypothetical protein